MFRYFCLMETIMNLRFLAYTCLALGALSQAAQAADVIYEEPAPAYMPTWSWAGGYIGGQMGYGWGSARTDANGYDRYDRYDPYNDPSDDDFSASLRLKPKGFLGGLYAGYNFAVGTNTILGVEADFIGTGMKDSYEDRIDDGDSDDNGAFYVERKLKWAGAVRARAGYAIDRFLPYISGGVAFGSIKSKVRIDDAITRYIGQNEFETNRTYTGWTIGGGVDYAATDNIILRLEYRYTDYGHKTDDYGLVQGRDSFKSNDIRLGVAYKF